MYFSLSDFRRAERVVDMPPTEVPTTSIPPKVAFSSSRFDSIDKDLDFQDVYSPHRPSSPLPPPIDDLIPPPGTKKSAAEIRPFIAPPLGLAACGPGKLYSKRQRKAMLICRRRASCLVLRRRCYDQDYEYDAPMTEEEGGVNRT